MSQKQKEWALTNDQIRKQYDNFAQGYSEIDTTMLTFYYTLVNMLNISKAKNILEVGCGTGKLIPYALSLKDPACTYIASDISSGIAKAMKHYLESYLQKLGVSDKLDDWMEKKKLEFRVVDGEKPIEAKAKFDRIICNLVLMITEHPDKMLQNLADVAEEGCLLGVTIWGDKKLSNFLTLPEKARQELKKNKLHVRDSFHLYNKLEGLANQNGWEVVVEWEQNAPFSGYELNPSLKGLISHLTGGVPDIANYVNEKANKIFEEKKILNFPVQMAILRRK